MEHADEAVQIAGGLETAAISARNASRMRGTCDVQAKAPAFIKSSASLSLGVMEHSNFGG